MSNGKGEFFAVNRHAFKVACANGLNEAVMLLVMARGSGKDNSTTMWSAEAAHRYTGLAWRRGKEAVGNLARMKLVTVEQEGKRPRYKLVKPESVEDYLWLPNTLVTGAGNEVPPLAKLRQAQNLDWLACFIELYGAQDLAADGGLPRILYHKPFKTRTKICEWGQYDMIGFQSDGMRYCTPEGPLARLKAETKTEPKGGWPSWNFLHAIEGMGLLERADYLAESEDNGSELIHPLSGDDLADTVAGAAYNLAESLPGGFQYEAQNYDYVLPVPRHMARTAVVGIARLRYRPRTSRTSAWWAQHVQRCEDYTALYGRLARGEFSKAA